MRKIRHIAVLIVWAWVCLMAGCGRDDAGLSGTPAPTGSAEVSFTLTTPSDLLVNTRSAAGSSIDKLDIIAFANDGSGNYTLDYRETSHIVENTGEPNKKTATVKLPVTGQGRSHKLVLLANVAEEMLEELRSGDDITVLDKLIHQNDGPWDADEAVPMWGETSSDVVVEGLNVSVSVKMLRMLARVDIVMNLADPDIFRLREVWVYHTNTSGRVVPDPGNLGASGSAVNTTLPDNVARFPTGDAFVYTAEDNSVRGIYLYELDQDENEPRSTAPAMVIGGMYDHDTRMTYYRLNLFTVIDDGQGNKVEIYPDILRNHLYHLSINEIYGKGYEDRETALVSSPALSGNLLTFDQGETQVYFDGENYLSVGENIYEFPRIETGGTLKVVSTQPWTFRVEDQASGWLSGTKTAEGIEFRLTANEGTSTRQGYITIRSGDFRAEVLFIQTTDEHIALSIRDRYGNDITELVFSSCPSDLSVTAQELTVSWAPADVVCIISASDGDEPFVYGANSAKLGDGTSAYGGSETFTIYPEALTPGEVEANPFIGKVKYLDFLVSDGEHFSTKRIVLRQQNYALLIDDGLYNSGAEFLMGKPYTLSVSSNAPWGYSFPYSSLDMLDWAEVDGNILRFRIRNDDSLYGTDVPVTLHSTDPDKYFVPVEVNFRVIRNFPNCYMLAPGETVSIPTAHIFDLHEKLFGTRPMGNLSAELVWKDRTADFITYGHDNGTIWVNASAAGNAVIAARVNGKVVWSWHIWVTPYDPETSNVTHTVNGYSNTFMTVNLGATTVSTNQKDNLGLYYQWGRKDPFPGPDQTGAGGNGNSRTVYDRNNVAVPVQFHQCDGSANLALATENPATFITSPSFPFDWYTDSRALQNDYLWCDESGYKTVFDPCPDGWRVPYIKDGTSPWDNGEGVNTGSNGVNLPLFGGYHPLSGMINYATGRIENLPLRTYLWMGTPTDEAAYGMTTGYYSFNAWDIRYRAGGCSVRCVRDN